MRPHSANWHKSSYSQSEAACIEIADLAHGSAVRDTRHRELGALSFNTNEWQAFLSTARSNVR